MSNAAPAANWFPDPSNPAQLRWWDGVQWSEHVHPAAEPASEPEPEAATETSTFLGLQVNVGGVGIGNQQGGMGAFGNVDLTGEDRFRTDDDLRRAARSVDGFANASSAEATPDWSPQMEAHARAELQGDGMTAEQVEHCVVAQRKLVDGIRKLEKNRFTRWIGHQMLRDLARRTSQSDTADTLDVTFGGVHYQAKGRGFRHG